MKLYFFPVQIGRIKNSSLSCYSVCKPIYDRFLFSILFSFSYYRIGLWLFVLHRGFLSAMQVLHKLHNWDLFLTKQNWITIKRSA